MAKEEDKNKEPKKDSKKENKKELKKTPKKDVINNNFLSKLSKKLENDDQLKLFNLASEEGKDLERMLRAKDLLEMSIHLGLIYSQYNWKEFLKLVLNDKKMSEVIGDMRMYIRHLNEGHEDHD